MDFSIIGTKEKIKLLSDIQNLLENEELRAGFAQVSSGELIWSLISEHLQSVTEDLLGTGTKEDPVKEEVVNEMGKLLSLVKAVNASPLIQILSQIASRGLKAAPAEQNPQYSQPTMPVQAPQSSASNVANPITSVPKVGTMGFL